MWDLMKLLPASMGPRGNSIMHNYTNINEYVKVYMYKYCTFTLGAALFQLPPDRRSLAWKGRVPEWLS